MLPIDQHGSVRGSIRQRRAAESDGQEKSRHRHRRSCRTPKGDDAPRLDIGGLPQVGWASSRTMIGLRPKRSARLPAASSRPAKTTANASTIHFSWLVVAPSWRTSDGRVTFMMVSSSTEMNSDKQRTARITQRWSWTELCVRTFDEGASTWTSGALLRVARAVLMIFLSGGSWPLTACADVATVH